MCASLLAGNYLDGTIPAELGSLPNLRVLNLGKNGFTDVGLGEHRADAGSLQLCHNDSPAAEPKAAVAAHYSSRRSSKAQQQRLNERQA